MNKTKGGLRGKLLKGRGREFLGCGSVAVKLFHSSSDKGSKASLNLPRARHL